MTRRLSGRFKRKCTPVRNQTAVLLRTAEEELHRWKKHFKRVLNRELAPNPPELEQGSELKIRTGCNQRWK